MSKVFSSLFAGGSGLLLETTLDDSGNLIVDEELTVDVVLIVLSGLLSEVDTIFSEVFEVIPFPSLPSQVSIRPISEAKNANSIAVVSAPIYRRFPEISCRRARRKFIAFPNAQGVFSGENLAFSVSPRIADIGDIFVIFLVRKTINDPSNKIIIVKKTAVKPNGKADGIFIPVVVIVAFAVNVPSGMERIIPPANPITIGIIYIKSCIIRNLRESTPTVFSIPILTVSVLIVPLML